MEYLILLLFALVFVVNICSFSRSKQRTCWERAGMSRHPNPAVRRFVNYGVPIHRVQDLDKYD